MKRVMLCGFILAALLLSFCGPPDPEQLATEAEDALSQNLYDEGIAKYKMVLEQEPANLKIRDKLAILLFSMGRFDEAAPQYGELVKHRSEKVGFNPAWGEDAVPSIDDKEKAKKEKVDEGLFYLGLCELKLKNYDAAGEHFARAVTINEGWKVGDFVVKSLEAIKDGTLTEACFAHLEDAIDKRVLPETAMMIPYYEKVLEGCPEFRVGMYNLGICRINAHKLDEAIEGFHNLIKVYPEDSDAHRYIGFLMARKGKLSNAIRSYKTALKHNPENAEALYQLGDVYNKRKNKREAIKYMKKYLEVEPEGYYARAARELLTELGVKGYEG